MKKKQGFAFVMVLLIVGVVAVLVAGSMLLSVVNRNISKNDVLSAQALNVSQAGGAFWKAELVSLYQHMMANFDQYEDELAAYLAANSGNEISCGNYFALGLDLNRDGDMTDAVDISSADINSSDGALLPDRNLTVGSSTGTAKVRVRVSGSAVELDSRGQFASAKGRVQEAFSINSVNVWNNAVFADSGAAQATIQGRAEIRGAVHLLGEGLSSSDMAIDVSGSFGLGNTYRGVSSSLKVDQMRLSTPDPKDLCATLRVRSGYVNMGGSAQIGYDDNDLSDDLIHNMRGIYTNDGFSSDAQEGVNVFSENGMNARYDAGNSFEFPDLNGQIEDKNGNKVARHDLLKNNGLVFDFDPIIGTLGAKDDRSIFGTTNNVVNRQYLTAGCFAIGSKLASYPTGPRYAGMLAGLKPFALTTLSVQAGPLAPSLLSVASGFAQGRGKGKKPTFNTGSGYAIRHGTTPSFSCAKMRLADGNSLPSSADTVVASIRWDQASSTLEIGGTGGVVTFIGRNLIIDGGNGSGVEIKYKGEGILFAESSSWDSNGVAPDGAGGNIIMGVDFLPATGETFPATTILGLVARNYVLSDGSQKRFTVAMYAQEGVAVEKQTLVAGGIVTRTFNAGSNVPTVLYVSNLAERVPDLMPGVGGGGFSISNVAWSRR